MITELENETKAHWKVQTQLARMILGMTDVTIEKVSSGRYLF